MQKSVKEFVGGSWGAKTKGVVFSERGRGRGGKTGKNPPPPLEERIAGGGRLERTTKGKPQKLCNPNKKFNFCVS